MDPAHIQKNENQVSYDNPTLGTRGSGRCGEVPVAERFDCIPCLRMGVLCVFGPV